MNGPIGDNVASSPAPRRRRAAARANEEAPDALRDEEAAASGEARASLGGSAGAVRPHRYSRPSRRSPDAGRVGGCARRARAPRRSLPIQADARRTPPVRRRVRREHGPARGLAGRAASGSDLAEGRSSASRSLSPRRGSACAERVEAAAQARVDRAAGQVEHASRSRPACSPADAAARRRRAARAARSPSARYDSRRRGARPGAGPVRQARRATPPSTSARRAARTRPIDRAVDHDAVQPGRRTAVSDRSA